jgi:two-component system nitrogen regulation response regulator GlnG
MTTGLPEGGGLGTGAEVPNGGAALIDANIPGMLGNSLAFRELIARIRKIGGASAPVLIEGETGVGKELAARSVHYLGAPRTDRSSP